MDAAVSLHHEALPAASSLQPPPHHHRALHLRHPPPSSSISTRLVVNSARPSRALARSSASSSSSSAAPVPLVPTHSTLAATGYTAALVDASLRAGTLLMASRHARALLKPQPPRGQRLESDPRVGALVRMLSGKGKAAMVGEVMAEFTAICDHLLLVTRHAQKKWEKRKVYAAAKRVQAGQQPASVATEANSDAGARRSTRERKTSTQYASDDWVST